MGPKPHIRVHFAGATSEPQEAALVPYRGGTLPAYTGASPVDTRALMQLLGAPAGRVPERQFETAGRVYDVSFGVQGIARAPGRAVAGVCLFDSGSDEGLRALREQAFLALHTGVFRRGAAMGIVACVDGCAERDARSLDARERAVRTALVEAGLPGDELPVVHLDVRHAMAREARWVAAIESLAETLDEHVPPIELAEGAFRMPIDDTFTIKGRGTVVTGRVERGSVRLGDEVDAVGPAGVNPTRIDGIEMARRMTDVAKMPDSVGLLLRDMPRELASRGAVLAAKGTMAAVNSARVRVVRLRGSTDDERPGVLCALRGVELGKVEIDGDNDDACELRAATAIPWEIGAPLALYRQVNRQYPASEFGALEGLAFARGG